MNIEHFFVINSALMQFLFDYIQLNRKLIVILGPRGRQLIQLSTNKQLSHSHARDYQADVFLRNGSQ